MEAPNLSRPNSDYQARMAPRYQAWCKSHPKAGKLPASPIKYLSHKIFSQKENTRYIASLPNDLIDLIVKDIKDVHVLRTLRAVSRSWKKVIDAKSPYWKLAEKERIQNELPKILLQVFGGAEAIQNIPFVDISKTKAADELKVNNPQKNPAFELNNRVTCITPAMFNGRNAIRTIDGHGRHLICLQVKTVAEGHIGILTFHESAPAFPSLRAKTNFGWTATYATTTIYGRREYSFHGPLSRFGYTDGSEDNICVLGNKELCLWSHDDADKVKRLINGEIVHNDLEVQGSICRVGFQLAN